MVPDRMVASSPSANVATHDHASESYPASAAVAVGVSAIVSVPAQSQVPLPAAAATTVVPFGVDGQVAGKALDADRVRVRRDREPVAVEPAALDPDDEAVRAAFDDDLDAGADGETIIGMGDCSVCAKLTCASSTSATERRIFAFIGMSVRRASVPANSPFARKYDGAVYAPAEHAKVPRRI